MHKPFAQPTEDMTWNQKRFNKRALAVRVLAHPLVDSQLMQPGFVHTRGNYGWILIGPVFHNGDLYRRMNSEGATIYGSVSALIECGMPEAELVSEGEAIRRALAHDEFLGLERESDGARFDVAMLHPWPTEALPRSCAIYLQGDQLLALNPELPARYNAPAARFSVVTHTGAASLKEILRARISTGRDE